MGALALLSLAANSLAAGKHYPSSLGVRGVEYDLTLSRITIKPGQSNVYFNNAGGDAHDLVIKRVGGKKKHKSGAPTPAGQVDVLHVTFQKDARYVLFCSLKHHRAKGMVAHLTADG